MEPELTYHIPVTWPAENSKDGRPSRILTLFLTQDIHRACQIALRAQHMARVRAAREGKGQAKVTMADLLDGVLVAGDEFLPEVEE